MDLAELEDRLEVHFADEDDDAAAIAALRRELEGNEELAVALRLQIDALLGGPEAALLETLRRRANRHCDFSPERARRWLQAVRAGLFG